MTLTSITSDNLAQTMATESHLSGGYLSPRASSTDNYVQPNLASGLRVWWAYYWPTLLISIFLISLLTFFLRKALENAVVSRQFVGWVSQILPYGVLCLVSMLGIYRILTKKFSSFYIALLPRNAIIGGEPLPRTAKRTLRVWWAFIWRAVVYSLIFRFAGSVALGLTIGFFASIGGIVGKLVPFVIQVLIDAAVGAFVIYSGLLDEEFGDFRVTLLPREAALSATPAVEPAAPNPIA